MYTIYMLAQDSISTRELRELLVPTHLHYDLGTESLRVRAFAEILTKVLFSLEKHRASFSVLAKEVALIASVRNIREEDICSGLRFLEEKGIVIQGEANKQWILTKEGYDKVLADIDSTNRKTEAILDNYFGTKIERDILQKWFRHAAAHFFGVYSDLWARTLYKRDLTSAPSELSLEQTLKKSIRKYRLKTHSEDLIKGFRSFIDNYKDPLVNEQIWLFAQAMLSARLITASIGPDPITIKEFKDAKIYLDTNSLLLAAIDDGTLAKSLTQLTESLKEINSTLHILKHTKEEYERVTKHKRAEIIKAFDNLPLEIISGAKDDFTRAAIERGCTNKEDVEVFFDTIADPAELFDKQNTKLNLEEEGPHVTAAKMAALDTKRQLEIGAEWSKIHAVPKTRNSIMHDAALDGAVELLRKNGEKAWIITRDTSMQNLSNRWTGNENFPIWLSLDALVQILAITSTGPSHDPTNYALLFSSIIEHEIQPGEGAFQIEDLSELIDLEERVRELDKSEIELFANKIAKLRISGKSRNHNELQLEIRRTFNRKKIDYGAKVRSLQDELISKEEDLERTSRVHTKTYKVLVGSLEKTEFVKIISLLTLSSFAFLIIGSVLIYLGLRLSLEEYPILVPVLLSLGISEILIPTVKWLLPGFKRARKTSQQKAHKRAKILLSEGLIPS